MKAGSLPRAVDRAGTEPGRDPGSTASTPEPQGAFHPRIGQALLRAARRLGVASNEWACLLPILVLGAADRFVNLVARGIWNTDQGVEAGAIWNAVVTRQLPTFGSPAFSVGGTFHHGALFYDLMIPFAWIGNGNPTVMVAAIAVFGWLVIPLVWWTARSIGGTPAGLAAALLAAVSPSLIDYSTLFWNPVVVELGVALACFGGWQAWRSRSPRWWVAAAAGTAIASQGHLTGLVLVLPMAALFLLALRRGPAGERRRLLAWGLAGLGLFVLTWMPWIVNELTHDFAETRAILAFSQPGPPAADPLTRFVVSAIRILAWPMTHWPLDSQGPGFPAALVVAVATTVGLIWRVVGAFAPASARSGAGAAARSGAGAAAPAPGGGGPVAGRAVDGAGEERGGLLFVGGSLLFITMVLGLGIKEVSQISNINQEQYHCVADVLVILASGLIVGGVWRAAPLRGRPWSGQLLASLALAGLVAVGVMHWPPLTAPDGGWPAAQAAADRLERDVSGSDMALVSLPEFKGAQAYGYPLTLDGVVIVPPDSSGTVVILCDTGWFQGCGGRAETDWLAANLPGRSLLLVDRFNGASDRILSVYRRAP